VFQFHGKLSPLLTIYCEAARASNIMLPITLAATE
jgi:hypothetical protein